MERSYSPTPLIPTLREPEKEYVLTGCLRIKRVEFKENVRAFFPQGQSKLSVRCPY